MCFANIFFQTMACFSIHMTVFFEKQKLFYPEEVQFMGC